MNPKAIYIFNLVAVSVIAVLWLTDVIGLMMFIGLIIAEASFSIWLAVIFMQREKEQVNAFSELFAAMVETRSIDPAIPPREEPRS